MNPAGAGLQLRPAHEADAATLLAIIRAAFAEYRGRLDPPSSAERKTLAVMRAELSGGAALVAELDGRPVGCVLYRPRGDALYWDRLSVLPQARGRGVASALMNAVEQRARELGLARAELSVRIALRDNQAIYAARGYRPLRQECHPGYSRPTTQVMEKQLA